MTKYLWSQSPAPNATIDPTINWQENQAPSTVNNSARAMMAAIAKDRDDRNGTATSSGLASAFVLTSNQGLASLTNGFMITFRAHTSNSAGATLAVDGLAAKPLATVADTPIGIAVLVEGSMFTVSYMADVDQWLVHIGQADPSPSFPGEYKDYAADTALPGWFLCNGQAASRDVYSVLFSIIGTTYGAGDGSTSFNVPDFRGRVAAGSDSMGSTAASRLDATTMDGNGRAPGDTGGEQTHALISAELASHVHGASSISVSTAPAHSHGVTDPGHSHTVSDYRTLGNVNVQSPTNSFVSSQALTGFSSSAATTAISINPGGAHGHNLSGNTGSVGTNGAHNNVQPTMIVYKLIKF